MKDLQDLSDKELEEEIEVNKTWTERMMDKEGYRRALADEQIRRQHT